MAASPAAGDAGKMQENWDSLGLESNAQARQLINSKGKKEEKVIYSSLVIKINKRGVAQSRVLMITDRAIYNLKPGEYTTLKRRILIENIGALSVSENEQSNEFVIHVPDEYDYRYQSEQKEIILDILSHEFKTLTRRKLAVIGIKDASLDDVTVTRDKAIFQAREEKLWQKYLAAQMTEPTIDSDPGAEAIEFESASTGSVNLDSFEPLKVLGRGAFGKVLQVRMKDTGKIYAMKILKKTMVFAKKQVDHTKAERQILSAFQHPFLMGLRFAFQTDARLYLVLDFYKGGELFYHLRRVKRFSEESARLYVAEVALGLGHLHSLDFIYRDLKPENVLVDDFGHLCLTDFGLAKHLNPEEEAHSFVGTPEYLAPEIVQQAGHGKAADWWCLGIFLYELTVGVTPFYAQKVDDMYNKIVNAKVKFPPRLSEECRDLISQLLVREPSKRLGSGVLGTGLTDVDEVKTHKFFDGLDWDKVFAKEIEPAYKPEISDDPTEAKYVLPHTEKIPIQDTYVDPDQLKKLGADGKVGGWTFDSRGAVDLKKKE
eukprot:TRINITY_DN1405_c0_g1_i1.p1 TRINITY_DN1405_c0_g1~~TRINITY_DN1405_c0_g1_i1.p1  ORF type:complete len:544 (+),score=155.01 TRINITY_DN1405_c0_g1_i1:39-1670(+)